MHIPGLLEKLYIVPTRIVRLLSEEKQIEVLEDKDFVQNELHISRTDIFEFILGFENEQIKLEMLELYEFSKDEIERILNILKFNSRISIDVIKKMHNFLHKMV